MHPLSCFSVAHVVCLLLPVLTTVSAALQEGSASDVWLQLLERCAAEAECQPTAVRSLAQQLAEQKALTARHEHQLSTQQQQLLVQEQQIADLQEQLSAQQLAEQRTLTTQLQQQVSDQQQGMLEQEQQIAGLQGRLQELHAAVQQLMLSQQH